MIDWLIDWLIGLWNTVLVTKVPLFSTLSFSPKPKSRPNHPPPPSPPPKSLKGLVRIRWHVDSFLQPFTPQGRLDARQRAGAKHRKRDRVAGEAGVGVEGDERLGGTPVLCLQRDPVAREGAVAGGVLDGLDEGEALEEGAVGLGRVGYQLFWGVRRLWWGWGVFGGRGKGWG